MAVFEHLLKLVTGDSEQNAQRLAARLEDVDQTAKQADKSLDRVGKSAGDVGSNAGKLTGILDRVNPGLGDMARLAADSADALEVASFAGGKLSLSAGTLATVAAGAALGIAAITAAVSVVANEMDKAAERSRAYRDALRDTETATVSLINSQNALKLAQGDVAGFVADLQIQTALLKGEVSQADVVAGELGGKLADALRQDLLAAGQALAAVQVQIQDVQRGLDQDGFSIAASNKLAQLRVQEQNLQRNLDAIKEAQLEGTAAINEYVQVLSDLENEEDKASNRTERTTQRIIEQGDAAKQAAAELERLQRLVGAINPTAGPTDAAGRGALATSAVLAASGISDADRSALLSQIQTEVTQGTLGEIDAAFGDLEDSLSGLIPAFQAYEAELIASRRALTEARLQTAAAALTGDPSAILSAVGGGLSSFGSAILGAGAGGLVAGGLSGIAGSALTTAAGPAGLILGALGGLGSLGAQAGLSPEQALKQQLEGQKEAIIAGIQALPEVLTEVIPVFVKELVTELPAAIAEALVDVLRRALEALLRVIFPNRFDNDDGRVSKQERQTAQDALAASAAAYEAATAQQGGAALGTTTARSARSLRLAASTRGLLAASRRGGGMRAGIVAPTFNALSADDRFMIDATERIARLTDPATGLRRGGA